MMYKMMTTLPDALSFFASFVVFRLHVYILFAPTGVNPGGWGVTTPRIWVGES